MSRKLLIPIAIISSACQLMDARGLKNYLTGFLTPARIDVAMSCAMLDGSRQGYCQFDASETQFFAIQDVLHLVPSPDQATHPASPSCPSWPRQNSHLYIADPPLAPMPGNTRSSFLRLWHDAQKGKVCAEMEYPYG